MINALVHQTIDHYIIFLDRIALLIICRKTKKFPAQRFIELSVSDGPKIFILDITAYQNVHMSLIFKKSVRSCNKDS